MCNVKLTVIDRDTEEVISTLILPRSDALLYQLSFLTSEKKEAKIKEIEEL
jgi:hypothetical protein